MGPMEVGVEAQRLAFPGVGAVAAGGPHPVKVGSSFSVEMLFI